MMDDKNKEGTIEFDLIGQQSLPEAAFLENDEHSELEEKKKRSKRNREPANDAVSNQLKDFSLKNKTRSLKPYMPIDIIGGSVPYVSGEEEEAVWNAAAQACGTDNIYITYTVSDGQCWYLTIPSASLASHPDTWCPLAAALPGNSEFWDKETVYIYEHDGIAAALRWDSDTDKMQVYSGLSRTILPRIQTMNANFVTINAAKATRVPWQHRALMSEQLSRFTVRTFFLSGLCVAIISLFIGLIASTWMGMRESNLAKVLNNTPQLMTLLVQQANRVASTDASQHISHLQDLLHMLNPIGGSILKYTVSDSGRVVWEARIPSTLSLERVEKLGATIIKKNEDGSMRIKSES